MSHIYNLTKIDDIMTLEAYLNQLLPRLIEAYKRCKSGQSKWIFAAEEFESDWKILRPMFQRAYGVSLFDMNPTFARVMMAYREFELQKTNDVLDTKAFEGFDTYTGEFVPEADQTRSNERKFEPTRQRFVYRFQGILALEDDETYYIPAKPAPRYMLIGKTPFPTGIPLVLEDAVNVEDDRWNAYLSIKQEAAQKAERIHVAAPLIDTRIFDYVDDRKGAQYRDCHGRLVDDVNIGLTAEAMRILYRKAQEGNDYAEIEDEDDYLASVHELGTNDMYGITDDKMPVYLQKLPITPDWNDVIAFKSTPVYGKLFDDIRYYVSMYDKDAPQETEFYYRLDISAASAFEVLKSICRELAAEGRETLARLQAKMLVLRDGKESASYTPAGELMRQSSKSAINAIKYGDEMQAAYNMVSYNRNVEMLLDTIEVEGEVTDLEGWFELYFEEITDAETGGMSKSPDWKMTPDHMRVIELFEARQEKREAADWQKSDKKNMFMSPTWIKAFKDAFLGDGLDIQEATRLATVEFYKHNTMQEAPQRQPSVAPKYYGVSVANGKLQFRNSPNGKPVNHVPSGNVLAQVKAGRVTLNTAQKEALKLLMVECDEKERKLWASVVA